jgi:hypothetical protein
MRRVLALLGGVAIATATFTGSVLAAPSERFSDTQTTVICENLSNDFGSAFLVAAESERFGTFGDLAVWAAPTTPEADPPTWIAGSSAVLIDGTSVSAAYDLFEFEEPVNPDDPPFGDPVGEATLAATLTPIGEPTPYAFDESQGNQTFRIEGVLQEFAVAGVLELPGGIVFDDLSTCVGSIDTFTVFATHPAAAVSHSAQLQVSCFWETSDGFVNVNGFSDEFGTFADISVSDATGDYFGFADAVLTTDSFDATMDLFDASQGGELDPVGSAQASATLTPTGERINDIFSFGPFKVHITGTVLAVDGVLDLTTPGGTQSLTMDAASCVAADQQVTQHQSPRQGPKGRPLANDVPEAAAPLAIGDSVTVRTGGTAVEAEMPCTLAEGDELPFGHTAWWTFGGTGEPVTIDTVGSDFDTVLAIYADDGGSLIQVACVDDVEDSLQARVTVDTVGGVTYYIQAGGFGADVGTLVLSLD